MLDLKLKGNQIDKNIPKFMKTKFRFQLEWLFKTSVVKILLLFFMVPFATFISFYDALEYLIVFIPWRAVAPSLTSMVLARQLWPRCCGAWPLCSSWQEQLLSVACYAAMHSGLFQALTAKVQSAFFQSILGCYICFGQLCFFCRILKSFTALCSSLQAAV